MTGLFGKSTKSEDLVEDYARSLGISSQELLEELDSRSIDEVGDDCLSPEEVQQQSTGELPEDRRQHLLDCADCRAVVAASDPTEGEVNQFMQVFQASCQR